MKFWTVCALTALVSGCAPALSYTADDCWRDKECRRTWKAEVASEMTELERAQRRGRHALPSSRKHIHKARVRDRDVILAGRADRVGPACQGHVTAVGERALSEDRAHEKALSMWQQQVQFRYGESYTAFHNAHNPRIVCTPAGLSDTWTGKIQQKWAGISHWRCELSGIPCRERSQPVARDE